MLYTQILAQENDYHKRKSLKFFFIPINVIQLLPKRQINIFLHCVKQFTFDISPFVSSNYISKFGGHFCALLDLYSSLISWLCDLF